MERLYQNLIRQHFDENQQMLFLAGPRQVGKTTIALTAEELTDCFLYLNYDNEKHRQILFGGEDAILRALDFSSMHTFIPILVLDEFHKDKQWKQFLKGFYDVYKSQINIIVTGSAKLDIYKSGSDSLMGRYFLYRIHPLTVSELLNPSINKNLSDLVHQPSHLDDVTFNRLLTYGGYPEPYLKGNKRFAVQWNTLRKQQLFREDIRDLAQIQDLAHLEMLAQLLQHQTGQLVNYVKLANVARVSVDTVRRWMNTLESFYYCFTIKPWFKNVKRSLLKGPKVFLWDWSLIQDEGARFENFVASHLLKAVQFWTDHGFGDFGLYFLRDKEKREVDFLITRDNKPWFMVEAKKSSNHSISSSLHYFQQQIYVEHAFQIVMDKPYVNKNCFTYNKPIIVSALTLLSQLI